MDLRTIDGALATALERHVVPRQGARGMVDALAAVLADRAAARTSRCPAGNAVNAALALRGMIGVADLARVANVSTRQLERLFHQRVGISPKLFVRIVRFQEVLRATRDGCDSGWATVALEHGFYDQAHFINDFKSFVGCTPGEWKINDDSLAAIFSAVRRPRAHGVAFFQDRRQRMA